MSEQKTKVASLDAVPSGIKAEDIAEKLKTEKQPSPVIDQINREREKAEKEKEKESSQGPKTEEKTEPEPGTDAGPVLQDHPHAESNAEIVTWVLTILIALVLAKGVDHKGNIQDYKFSDYETEQIEKGWTIFFKSLKNDHQVPGLIAPLMPMAMAIWDKTELAMDNAKRKKAEARRTPPPGQTAEFAENVVNMADRQSQRPPENRGLRVVQSPTAKSSDVQSDQSGAWVEKPTDQRPQGETPDQKIARLERELAAAAPDQKKMAESTRKKPATRKPRKPTVKKGKSTAQTPKK